MKEELKQRRKSTHDISDVVIPFHGPKVTFDNIIQSLKEPFNIKQAANNQACIFHFDISPNVCILLLKLMNFVDFCNRF